MSPAKSSIQSIDLDDLERKLRNFVDPRSPKISSGSEQGGAGTARVENFRTAKVNQSTSGGQGLSPFGARSRELPATAKTTDLDAVEKQLREVAADVLRKPVPASKESVERLNNLSQLVGRGAPSEAAGPERARKTQTSSATPTERKASASNLPRDIAQAYQGRAAKAAMKHAFETAQARKPRETSPAPGANARGNRPSTPQQQMVRRFDHEARAFLAGAAARLDHMGYPTTEPEAVPHPSLIRQGVVLRSARSLALPLLLLALGAGTAIVMLSPVGEHPRGQMKEAHLQAPTANSGSGGGVPDSPALNSSTPAERTKLPPAKSDPSGDFVKAAPASPPGAVPSSLAPASQAAATPSLAAPASPAGTTAAAPSVPAPAPPAPVAAANETKTASADPAPVSPPTTGQTPAAAANASTPATSIVASDDAPPAQAQSSSAFSSSGAVSASAPKIEDTPVTSTAPANVSSADAAQSAPPLEPAPSTPATDQTAAAVAQLPDVGSAPAGNASTPRAALAPNLAMPTASTEPSVANNPPPVTAPETTGAPATPPGTGDKTATGAQGEGSHAGKPPLNAPRTIEPGKTINGAAGAGTPSAKTISPAPPANEGSVPAKTAGTVLASKPILTRPAKPAALIATGHLPPAHAMKPPPSPEPKPVDENTHGTSTVGAPLMITPPEPSEPMLEANATPAETPQAAEKPEKPIDAPPASATGAPFSLRLASSLSESDARATLSQLQKEFPGALQSGSVTRDNLGSYGVFYRVKVGPLPREAAERICSRLRAAGRKCVLTRG